MCIYMCVNVYNTTVERDPSRTSGLVERKYRVPMKFLPVENRFRNGWFVFVYFVRLSLLLLPLSYYYNLLEYFSRLRPKIKNLNHVSKLYLVAQWREEFLLLIWKIDVFRECISKKARLLHSNFNLLEGCLRWGRNFSRRAFVGGNGWEAKKGIRAWKSGAILEATCFETTALGIDA